MEDIKYLQVYRLLRDNTVVRIFDVTPDESRRLEAVWTPDTVGDYDCFVGPDQKVLIKFGSDDNAIYENKDTFNKLLRVGLRSSSSIYFMYCPSASEFMAKKASFIQDLFAVLGVTHESMNYTRNSIQKLESALMARRFKARQEVQRCFLGILAYCGETLCHVYNAKWHIKSKDATLPDPDWEVAIEIRPGVVWDSFADLHENLFVFDGNVFLPLVHVSTNASS